MKYAKALIQKENILLILGRIEASTPFLNTELNKHL